jgi:hypothetical protein
VDEFIVATMASDTRLAAISRAKIQPGQNLLRESNVVRLSFGQRRGFCDIQNHTGNHCHGSHCPT